MGPLHGFPHAVKDLQPVKGMRTTMGSPIFKDFTASATPLMTSAGALSVIKDCIQPQKGSTLMPYRVSLESGADEAIEEVDCQDWAAVHAILG
jgi:Amidase